MDRPDFNPGRLDPCFCKSGQRFKNCCGSRAAGRLPPKGVHIISNFLEPGERSAMVEWADTQQARRMGVVDQQASNQDKIETTYSEQRVAEHIFLGNHLATFNSWIERAIYRVIQPAFRREAEWFESAALMRYRPGGKFLKHADSERLIREQMVWRKILDRDVSILIYLNDDYEGGHLSFPVFNFRYKPRAGDMICFPSDSRFQHEAEVLESGRRYAVVSWVALKGVDRVMKAAPETAVFV